MIDDGTDETSDALPATMADMFFALVAIVIFLLLALAPSLGRPAAPADKARDVWTSDMRIGGRQAAVIVADAAGLRLGGEEAQRVALERILDDAALAAFLDEARTDGRPLLFAIEEEGQEASFLFDVAAAGHGVAEFSQVRVDPGCPAGCMPGIAQEARP